MEGRCSFFLFLVEEKPKGLCAAIEIATTGPLHLFLETKMHCAHILKIHLDVFLIYILKIYLGMMLVILIYLESVLNFVKHA